MDTHNTVIERYPKAHLSLSWYLFEIKINFAEFLLIISNLVGEIWYMQTKIYPNLYTYCTHFDIQLLKIFDSYT